MLEKEKQPYKHPKKEYCCRKVMQFLSIPVFFISIRLKITNLVFSTPSSLICIC